MSSCGRMYALSDVSAVFTFVPYLHGCKEMCGGLSLIQCNYTSCLSVYPCSDFQNISGVMYTCPMFKTGTYSF